MPTPDQYRYCTRLGMTQAECAAHLGVSPAAVSKAKARLQLEFGTGMAFSQGKQWEMRYNRYPFAEMEIGDWTETYGYACSIAQSANASHAPKVFKSITRGGLNRVMRSA